MRLVILAMLGGCFDIPEMEVNGEVEESGAEEEEVEVEVDTEEEVVEDTDELETGEGPEPEEEPVDYYNGIRVEVDGKNYGTIYGGSAKYDVSHDTLYVVIGDGVTFSMPVYFWKDEEWSAINKKPNNVILNTSVLIDNEKSGELGIPLEWAGVWFSPTTFQNGYNVDLDYSEYGDNIYGEVLVILEGRDDTPREGSTMTLDIWFDLGIVDY